MEGAVCMEGINKKGLMVIKNGRSDQDFALRTAATSHEITKLWHRCFMHLGFDNLYEWQSKSMVDGISVASARFEEQQKEVCEPCKAAPALIS